MNADRGVVYVLMEHFARHLYPRALEMEKKLAAGGRLSDSEIYHLTQVIEEAKLLRPLIERHPEHREIADGVAALYANIARRAWENETAGEGARRAS
jgi:hypothetical protein